MPHLSRKEFLKRTLLASVAVPFAPLLTQAAPLHIPLNHRLMTDEAFWAEVRKQYLLDDCVVNLNNGAVSPQPIAVQQSHISMYEQSNKAPSYFMWGEVDGKREQLRTALATLMSCNAEEVAINRNTTEGLNTVILGLNLKAGDEVVVSDFDYPFMLNAWKQRAQRDGIVLKTVKLPLPLEDDEKAVDVYRLAITSKTKVVHLTHVLNWTGQIMPVKKVTQMAQQLGCEVMVDAAHALAHVPLSFQDIGCDYMATSLHKWLGAPFGTGALIIKKEKIASVWPLLSAREPKSADIRKFELLGTRSFPAEMAVLDAIVFHQKIGLEKVNQRLHYLKAYWSERVSQLQHVTFHTSLKPEFSGAMATFSIAGMTSTQIADTLFETYGLHVGIIQWNRLDAVRVSPHIYTTLAELDRLVNAVAQLTKP
ncbi:MAG: aminotransferase class V-fold PLP-dependent enzyme [Flavobacteriales bacterium]|jgi:selenocysteine lyase/cysteine desulfurase|nr:aminotransferase class V-fold PLP-dependent enzyme [Flavobacteriales bacterium]